MGLPRLEPKPPFVIRHPGGRAVGLLVICPACWLVEVGETVKTVSAEGASVDEGTKGLAGVGLSVCASLGGVAVGLAVTVGAREPVGGTGAAVS